MPVLINQEHHRAALFHDQHWCRFFSPCGSFQKSYWSHSLWPLMALLIIIRERDHSSPHTNPEQYASYPTTDIRHILPLLLPSFKKVTQNGNKATHGESLAEKQSKGRVESLVSDPKGEEIKHEWLWPRMGNWFVDNGMFRFAFTVYPRFACYLRSRRLSRRHQEHS
jgi:hypothetical protein